MIFDGDGVYLGKLIDALCVYSCGWNNDIEKEMHDEAYIVIHNHKTKLLLEREIRIKKEQLEYLKTGKEPSC